MLRWLVLISLLLLVAAVGLTPRPDLYGHVTFSTLVTDRNDQPLQFTLATDGRYRLFVPLEDMADVVTLTTLTYEDRWFYQHPGINPVSILRSIWTTYLRRSRRMGGSTVSMQLARMRFDLDTRTPAGKLVQMGRAIQLERHYSKHEILEAYLNLAPYGGSVEGMGTASWVYFGKSPSELSLTEAMTLAVVPQNPAVRSPARSAGHRELAAARRRLLGQWLERHPQDAESVADFASPMVFRTTADLPFRAPHFVRDHVTVGERSALTTTLDLRLQTMLERRIQSFVRNRQAEGLYNAAAMLVDTRSMDVLALVGSAEFFDEAIQGQVNGVRARRSPGSTLKPLLYGLALERGLIHPMSLLKDAPRRYAAYTPENFDRGFMGPVFARDALIYSRNVPAVNLLAQLGVHDFHDWLEAAGVEGLRGPDVHGLALALGGNEASMEELVSLYALLANGGKQRALNTMLPSIEAPPPQRLLSPEASYLVLDILKDVQRPATLSIETAARPAVAWKTGTSFGHRDAWSIGIVGDYALAVWVGNFDGSANPRLVGSVAAAPLFFSIVDSLAVAPSAPSPDPGLNLRLVDVCAPTGDLPGRHCPGTKQSWFIPGVSPIKVSTIHRPVTVDVASGLRSCGLGHGQTRQEVYEFWPSDLRRVFRRAGISQRRPPVWEPGCDLEATSNFGAAPRIASPLSTLAYQIPVTASPEAIVFAAVSDADTQTLYWFVDNQFVAQVDRDETFFWKPRIGQFRVKVVDDLGRAATIPLRVEATALRGVAQLPAEDKLQFDSIMVTEYH